MAAPSPRAVGGLPTYRELQDFDWSLRMVLSSSSASSMRKPLLLLRLHSRAADGSQEETTIEMDAAELDTLLRGLEEARRASAALRP